MRRNRAVQFLAAGSAIELAGLALWATRGARSAIVALALGGWLILRGFSSLHSSGERGAFRRFGDPLARQAVGAVAIGIAGIIVALLGLTGIIRSFQGGTRMPFLLFALAGLIFVLIGVKGYRLSRRIARHPSANSE